MQRKLLLECLKDLFRLSKLAHFKDHFACITEVAKVIETESVDLEVDRPLHEACSLDLAKFCREVSSGNESINYGKARVKYFLRRRTANRLLKTRLRRQEHEAGKEMRSSA